MKCRTSIIYTTVLVLGTEYFYIKTSPLVCFSRSKINIDLKCSYRWNCGHGDVLLAPWKVAWEERQEHSGHLLHKWVAYKQMGPEPRFSSLHSLYDYPAVQLEIMVLNLKALGEWYIYQMTALGQEKEGEQTQPSKGCLHSCDPFCSALSFASFHSCLVLAVLGCD